MKRHLHQTIFTLLLSLCITTNAQVVTNGLLVYYPFNGNANDESNHGHHGTAINGAALTTDRFGIANAAYSFDGVNDYIEVPHSNSFNLTSDLSISVWVNQSALGATEGRIIDKGTATIGDGFQLDNYGNALSSVGRFHKARFVGHGSNWDGANTAFNLNEWHHIVVTYQSGTYTYYTDNINDGTIIDGSNGLLTNILTLRIGASHGALNRFFTGKIDDIYIFDRVITDLEVADLFNEGTVGIHESSSTPVSNIYPVPSSGILHLELKNSLGEIQLVIFNTIGEVVFSEEIKKDGNIRKELDLSALPKGIYFISLKTSENIIRKKIILEE